MLNVSHGCLNCGRYILCPKRDSFRNTIYRYSKRCTIAHFCIWPSIKIILNTYIMWYWYPWRSRKVDRGGQKINLSGHNEWLHEPFQILKCRASVNKPPPADSYLTSVGPLSESGPKGQGPNKRLTLCRLGADNSLSTQCCIHATCTIGVICNS